jgi:type I restriction enzyme S subunit
MDGLNTTILKECELRVPSLHKQEAMLSKLDTASRLSHKCRFSLDMSEDLFRAVFLEMFGDPVRNPMEWPLVELCDLLDRIDSGYSPVCEGPRGSVSEWAVLGLGAVTSGRLKTEENKLLPDQSKARIELEVKDRDVLVTRKNTADLVAACALVRKPPPKLLLPDTVFRFVPKAKSGLYVSYLWGLMSAPRFRKQKVQSLAAGSAGSMPGISKEKFLELSIPLPSLERQLKYDRVVDRHNQVRSVLEESLRQAEHLFQSLLHEAFGETRDTVRGDARRP